MDSKGKNLQDIINCGVVAICDRVPGKSRMFLGFPLFISRPQGCLD